MRVAIVDADLISRYNHRFPNLACEKISAFHKEAGHDVHLETDYGKLDSYDEVFVSKVFTDTPVPDWLKPTDRIHLGGTGFYFDKAPKLPDEIEHHMPDYHLYDDWIHEEMRKAESLALIRGGQTHFDSKKFLSKFKEYTDYSIGFTTRGCFRKCPFCVNQHYNRVFLHSPLEEFYDASRKKICLLDDNILGCGNWKQILNELIATKKPFKYKQGMDERLLTDEKCEILFNCKYDGDYTFAFDNIKDYQLIHDKLRLIRNHTSSGNIIFYVLVGFESTDITDIVNAFKRISLLMRYRCKPYIMRYQSKDSAPWKESEFQGMYVTLARWCNQPSMFKTKTFREFCELCQRDMKTDNLCAAMKALRYVEASYPDVAEKYFDMRFPEEVVDNDSDWRWI